VYVNQPTNQSINLIINKINVYIIYKLINLIINQEIFKNMEGK
jgi:hypothetical protein